MPSRSEYFVREFDINLSENKQCTLKLHQKSLGDVNCIVWDAAMVLAKYLEIQNHKHPNCYTNRNVLELGAGVGCVGLTAALLGANVTLTDLPEAVSIMEDNIVFNKDLISASQGSATAKILNWGQKTDLTLNNYEFIILSDCVYYLESIEALINTLVEMCGTNATIIQCQEIRDTKKQQDIWNTYFNKLQAVFDVQYIPKEEQHYEFTCDDIKLLKLTSFK